MNPKDIETLEEARSANPFYFQALMEAAAVMSERRKKYSGNRHPYFNFVDLSHRTGLSMDQVFDFYLAIKDSRLSVSQSDFDDERVVDTLIDKVNYTILKAGWHLGKCTPADIDQIPWPNPYGSR